MDADQSQGNDDFSVDLEDPEQADNSGAAHSGAATASPPTSAYFPGWTPKNIKKKKRTIIATVTLLVGGFVLLCIGAGLATQSDTYRSVGIALLVIGSLACVPGAYAGFLLWKAFRAHPGYSLDNVPDW